MSLTKEKSGLQGATGATGPQGNTGATGPGTGVNKTTYLSAAYKSAVLVDTPSSYFRMDAAAGTVENDLGSLNNPGTYINSPTLGAAGATADGDAAVTFVAASNQKLQIPDNDAYS